MESFLGAMRRRLDRDRDRVHAYHDHLRRASLKRFAALARADGDRADADCRRERLRIEAVEREYRAKLDDLRRNYALRLTVDWVQALDLYVPVQRFDVLIRRRKSERLIQLDWHPAVRTAEPPLCERRIERIVGVVESGLFVGRSSAVIVATTGGVKVLTRDKS